MGFPQLGIATDRLASASAAATWFEVSIKVRNGSGAALLEFKKGAFATLATFGQLLRDPFLHIL